MKHKFTHIALPALASLGFIATSHAATTITEDFEGELTDGSAPTGWTIVNTDVANWSYSTTAGTGTSASQSGNFTRDGRGSTNDPKIWMVNSGVAFDATQAFSGSFDFYVVEEGNYSDGKFIIGDVQSAVTGLAGEYINVHLDEKQFGSRADIYDGDGSTLYDGGGNNNATVLTGQWNNVTSFTWTPTSGTTGDFTINWDNTDTGTESMSITGYTFTSNEVYFGFGAGDADAYFDNISITGTAIPEPSSTALLGLAGLALIFRRRK